MDDVIGFVDNRANLINEFEGKPVYLPKTIIDMEWDAIVIMSLSCIEICSQLLSLGITAEKIVFWEWYYAYLKGNQTDEFFTGLHKSHYKLKILLVATDVCFDGASMVMLYTAKELSSRGHKVEMLAPYCNKSLLKKLLSCGVDVKVNQALKFLKKESYKGLDDYDIAIVNVYPNVRVACELSRYIPTLWWIHENGKYFDTDYARNRVIFFEYNDLRKISNIRVAAVSKWAADVFEQYYPERVDTILPLGIPDEKDFDYECSAGKKITFAIIGRIEERKAQDVFVEAISILPGDVRNRASFIIIGSDGGGDKYIDDVKKRASKFHNVQFTGILDRKSMRDKFKEIDVVVCSSREETLSIAVIEGMMNSKVCITTDATGIAEFMHDGVDGFVIPHNNAEALAKKMEYVIENILSLGDMRSAARATYENNFDMKSFGDRLEQEINKTIDGYRKKIMG